jgi:hypothetical protein
MTEGNYSNVGQRGPVYKGLCAMNPCDLSSLVRLGAIVNIITKKNTCIQGKQKKIRKMYLLCREEDVNEFTPV